MPASLGASGVLVASAPLGRCAAGAVVPLADCLPRQVLFGWEAQMQAFASQIATLGRTLFVVPAPEIFSSRESHAHIARATGWDGRGALTHLRFGMPYFARVVKGAHNVMVLAEHRITTPLTPTHHPFGGGNRLPTAMAQLLLYQPQSFLPRRSNGGAIASECLAAGFAIADLPPPPARGAAARVVGSDASGLIVRSFAEYDPAAWQQPPAAVVPPALLDWRGVVAMREVARERGEAVPRMIMVPWNLAHPASIIPDLVEKLAHSGGLAATIGRLVLFPYNETTDSAGQITAVIENARQLLHAAPADLRHLFIARLASHRAAATLASLFEIAWLEADAPDRLWTERRLMALGLPTALLATAPEGEAEATPPHHVPPRFVAAADEVRLINADDQFGGRLFSVGTLSARALAALLHQTLEEAAAEEAAAEETPVEETPAEETPAEETPVETASAAMGREDADEPAAIKPTAIKPAGAKPKTRQRDAREPAVTPASGPATKHAAKLAAAPAAPSRRGLS